MWQDSLQYKFNFFIDVFSELYPLIVYIVLWTALFQIPGQETIKGYTLAGMITYYIFARLINQATSVFSAEPVIWDIKEGSLSFNLVKPYSYIWAYFYYELSHGLMRTLFNGLFILGIFLFFNSYLAIPSLINLLLFFVFFALAFILSYWIKIIFAFSAFWITESRRFYRSIKYIISFLSGAVVPLVFFPQIIQDIFVYLPFSYLIYFPIRVLQAQASVQEMIVGGIVTCVWIIICYLLTNLVFKLGVKRYEAVGN